MTEQNVKKENQNGQHENELSFDQKVLEKIANYAAKNIDGILELKGGAASGIKGFFSSNDRDDTKGVTAEVGKEEVALDLEVVGEYGKDLTKAFDELIEEAKKSVENMTGLTVVEVNMHVADIMTREDYEYQQNEDERNRREDRREEYRDRQERNRDGRYDDGSRVR